MMSLSSVRRAAFAFCLILIAPLSAGADIFKSADFALSRGEAENQYAFSALLPTNALSSAQIGLPDGCHQDRLERQPLAKNVRVHVVFSCTEPLQTDAVLFAPWRLDGARFRNFLNPESDIVSLTGVQAGVEVPLGDFKPPVRPLIEIVGEFLWQGMLHIWMGWDHLAFVLCLCLIASGYRLLELVTTFTLGHSVSLGLSFFDVVRVPISPVEAVIALSIAVMAREALVQTPQQRMTGVMRYAIVVALFGLLHGLGFASALGELGVPSHEKWPALIFFNIGVEMGQIVFVGGVFGVLYGLGRIGAAGVMRTASLYGVGVIGAFWTIERIASFI